MRIAVLIAAVSCAASALAQASVIVENAWVASAPPTVKVHAAYMAVVNHGATGKDVIGAESPDYERIELHRSLIKDGVSSMQPVEKLAVPAHGHVELAPGGLHLMLLGPKRPQAMGDRITIVLRLDGGEAINVSAVVRPRDDTSHGSHSHH